MTLEVASQTMRTSVAVRTVQQRMNVFHIRVDLNAGLRGSKYDEILLLLSLVLVCIVKRRIQRLDDVCGRWSPRLFQLVSPRKNIQGHPVAAPGQQVLDPTCHFRCADLHFVTMSSVTHL